MSIRYLASETSRLYKFATGGEHIIELLWGDHLTVMASGVDGGRHKVHARGRTGYVDAADVGDESLLELYFIDVGQGDGVLIRTPDNRHIMIDGGFKRASQPTGKNAADFVDWKFFKDYGMDAIHLDAMIASHNDADHYGGLSDLLDVEQEAELDAQSVTVEKFYHAGVAWWKKEGGGRWLGESTDDRKYLTQLMGDRDAVLAALQTNADAALQGEWATLMKRVIATTTSTGAPTPVIRLSRETGALPGFEPGNSDVAITILAPVEFTIQGQPALHNFGSSESHSTNGNSVLLRLDYGDTRVLLTGDLNSYSQRALLADYADDHSVFACDVAKACHHGSDDVHYKFLATMKPAVTVISSGDTERHDHPRPSIVAASAISGHVEIVGDKLLSPLVYSTELARSLDLGKVSELTLSSDNGAVTLQGDKLVNASVEAKVRQAGDLNPSSVTKNLKDAYIVTGLTYGLVNIRTDGKRILCATLNEGKKTWQVKELKSRFSPEE